MTSIQTEAERAPRGEVLAERSTGRIGEPPFPLLLQQCAPRAVRHHALANVVRVGSLLLSDLAAIVATLALAAAVAPQVILVPIGLEGAALRSAADLLVALIVGLWVLRCYRAGDYRRDPSGLALGVALGLGLACWQIIWESASLWPVFLYVADVVLVGSAVILGRYTVDLGARHYRTRTGRVGRTLLVGRSSDLEASRQHAAIGDPTEFAIIATVDADARSGLMSSSGIRGTIATMRREAIDTVIIAGALEDEMFARVLDVADAAGCSVYVVPRPIGFAGLESRLVWRRSEPLLEMTRPGIRGQQLVAKRALDLVVSGLGLLLFAPLFLLIGIAIKLSSRGPVFFRQERCGKGGEVFQIVKFRTMGVDAEEQKVHLAGQSVYADPRLFKMKRDPRVTRVGAFLRRTSLDELPQLWNVLTGDMSLVGPRPPLPSEVAHYEEHQYARFDVPPGITGPWQVSGRSNITDFDQVMRLETAYIRSWTIWKDIQILLRTIPAVLRMDGAH